MKNEPLELQFADSLNLRPHLERRVSVFLIRIGALNESQLGIEIRPDLPLRRNSFQPVRFVMQRCPEIAGPAWVARRLGSRQMPVKDKVLQKYESRINSSCLVVTVRYVARPLVYAHNANIRPSPQRFFQSHHRI